MNKNSKKGFTLVELSIVLVIIGLLIGGILAAQSMIGTAKIQALTRQFGQFDAAITNFQTKFGGLPGDTAAVYANGNGDGLIQSATPTSGTVKNTTTDGEIANFWQNLSVSGLTADNGAGSANTPVGSYAALSGAMTFGSTATAPKAKAGSNGAGILAAGITTTNTAPITSNFYLIVDAAQTAASNAWAVEAAGTAALTSAEALALDTKLDDGSGITGNVQSAKVASATAVAVPSGIATTGCPAAATYDLTKTTRDCDLAVRIGINTGTVQ